MENDDQNMESTPSEAQSGVPTGNSMKIVAVIVVIVIIAAVGYFIYGVQGKSNEPSSMADVTETEETKDEEESMIEENASVREIEVEGSEYSFSPSTITVTEGEVIKLTFTNTGAMPHNFIIDELGVNSNIIANGQSDTVEFTANRSGTFAFYCSVGNHRNLGMEGEIDVQ